jgi:hypothetical protein
MKQMSWSKVARLCRKTKDLYLGSLHEHQTKRIKQYHYHFFEEDD